MVGLKTLMTYKIFRHRSRNQATAVEQGAAPDRLQPALLRSCLASSLRLPAAGELSRCVAAPALVRETGSTLAADTWSREIEFGGVGVFVAAACSLWCSVLGFGG